MHEGSQSSDSFSLSCCVQVQCQLREVTEQRDRLAADLESKVNQVEQLEGKKPTLNQFSLPFIPLSSLLPSIFSPFLSLHFFLFSLSLPPSPSFSSFLLPPLPSSLLHSLPPSFNSFPPAFFIMFLPPLLLSSSFLPFLPLTSSFLRYNCRSSFPGAVPGGGPQ